MEQISIPDIPFSILALAPFTPEISHEASAKILTIDPIDIDQTLLVMAPSFFVSLPLEICPAGGVQIQLQRMRDFTPDGLLESQPYLTQLLEADLFCNEAEQQKMSPQDILQRLKTWPALPQLLPASAKEFTKGKSSSLENILSMVDLPGSQSSVQVEASTGAGGTYGALACQILDAIFADPTFRSLESCWFGLRHLGRYLAAAGGRLEILSASTEDIKEVLEENRERLITQPPSLFLIDQAFSSSERSIQILDTLAQFGQEMLVPVLAWADYSFFQISSWIELDKLSFLPNYFEGASFASYRSLQQSDSGRWIALACNRFLTRFPYGPEYRSRVLPFKEQGLAWHSPVWGVAALMASRVKEIGWPTGMASSAQCLLEDLAITTEGLKEPGSLEVKLSKNRLEQLTCCGIMPLAGRKGTDTAFLAGDVMLAKNISLSYQLLVCRVSHFILWCRDHWQECMQEEELESRLRTGFQLFAEEQGPFPAGDVTVTCRLAQGALNVSFCWRPSSQILSTRQEIVLEFSW